MGDEGWGRRFLDMLTVERGRRRLLYLVAELARVFGLTDGDGLTGHWKLSPTGRSAYGAS